MAAQDLLWVLVVLLGVRLLIRWLREHAAAEGALGGALVFLGAGAATLRVSMDENLPMWAVPSLVLVTVGGVLIAIFTRLAFRPREQWARWVVVGAALLLVGGLYHALMFSGIGSGQARPSPVFLATRALVLGWSAFEALRFRRTYMKRAALGLADPVIANRFLLYSIWTSALALMPLVVVVAVAMGDPNDHLAWRTRVLVPMRITGLVCLVTVYLTFLPPARYLRFIVARHEAAGKSQ